MAILALGLDCRITQFVDDLCTVAASASIIQTLRKVSDEVLNSMCLTLHPTKFYIQPVMHGVAFCGRVIYADRMYIGNRTVRACRNTVKKAIRKCSLENAYRLQNSLNSYIGFMCHTRSFNIQRQIMQEVLESGYSEWLYFKVKQGMVICKVKDIYKPKTMRRIELQELSDYQKQSEYEFSNKHRHKHCA